MLTCVTPTGGRPEALGLLNTYMAGQIDQDFRWLVLDDCDPESPAAERADEVIRPDWRWQPGDNTLCRSLSVLLERAPSGPVLIIEDDDAYLPGYVMTMRALLRGADIVGEKDSLYYHVGNRTWRRMIAGERASLCATGVTGRARSDLERLVAKPRHALDVMLWERNKGKLISSDLCIGIKGLPGRPGIGMGHGMDGTPDPDLSVLKTYLGSRASWYAGFAW